jgi:hypothetical protein
MMSKLSRTDSLARCQRSYTLAFTNKPKQPCNNNTYQQPGQTNNNNNRTKGLDSI